MNQQLPRRKTRTLVQARLWKTSCTCLGIPVVGWLAVLILSRLLSSVGWIDSDQAMSMAVASLISIPLHGLVVLGLGTLGSDLEDMVAAASWRTLGAVIATSAPVFTAVVLTNLVLNEGHLSLAQTMIGATAAHVALLCVAPLLSRAQGD